MKLYGLILLIETVGLISAGVGYSARPVHAPQPLPAIVPLRPSTVAQSLQLPPPPAKKHVPAPAEPKPRRKVPVRPATFTLPPREQRVGELGRLAQATLEAPHACGPDGCELPPIAAPEPGAVAPLPKRPAMRPKLRTRPASLLSREVSAETELPAEPVAPLTYEPIEIEFRDPDRTVAVCGERVALEIKVLKGKPAVVPNAFSWIALPAGTVGLKISRDQSEADFTTRFPGVYTFAVAVAGEDGSVAQKFKTVELRSDAPQAPPAMPVSAAAPPEPRGTIELEPQEMVRRATADVRDTAKAQSLALIRETLREVAASIDHGILRVPEGMKDYLGYLMQATRGRAESEMGHARFLAWSVWFDQLEDTYRKMQGRGAILAPSNVAAAHRSTASVLEGM